MIFRRSAMDNKKGHETPRPAIGENPSAARDVTKDTTRRSPTFPGEPACAPLGPHPTAAEGAETAPHLGGILLAAGRASRMGESKTTLQMAHGSALAHAATALRGGVNGPIVVVTGFHEQAVREEATRLGLEIICNPAPERGMFSSIRCGLTALRGRVDAAFVLPADMPLIRPATCALLAEAFRLHRAAVTYPCFYGERGHPPLLHAVSMDRALAHSGEGGLRVVLDAIERAFRAEEAPSATRTASPAPACRTAPTAVHEVETCDAGILADMDTPEDFARLATRSNAQTTPIPTRRECAALLDLAGTPPATRAHCRKVALAALLLLRVLRKRRSASTGNDDSAPAKVRRLVWASALLHDICKGARHHETAGAVLLTRHGFPEVAEIVGAHRDIDPATATRIGPRELVMLADKFIQGTNLIPLEERYAVRLRQWAHAPEVVADISKRQNRASRLCAMLESEIGEGAFPLLCRYLAPSHTPPAPGTASPGVPPATGQCVQPGTRPTTHSGTRPGVQSDTQPGIQSDTQPADVRSSRAHAPSGWETP